ncbi:MAG: flavin reductase family protein [Bacteroidetes bacterium]|nr:flavin reductase family protein [Bacteroidota bacterium]
MEKINWKPGTMLYPLPAIMVSCGATEEEFNIITIAWTGTICSNPPMCYISVQPKRHSYEIIKRNMDFVINLTTEELAFATDWCGVKSGRDMNKFNEMKLTPTKAQLVKSPLIGESPVNIECVVKEIKSLGSHDMFIAEVVAINVDPKFLNPETQAFDMEKAKLICYSHGKYFNVGNFLGGFGFSVMKPKTKKKKRILKKT